MSTINAVGTGLSGSTGTGDFVGSASPTISGTLTLSGSAGLVLPSGNTAARGSTAGMIRLNTQTSLFESTVDGSAWATIETSAVGVTSIVGTSNQVIASNPTGTVTLSLPQSIATTSTPIFAGINDSNSNTMLHFNPSASAVNYFQFQNGATGQTPQLLATGSDTNVSLQLTTKGTGGVALQGTSTNNSAASGYVGENINSQIVLSSKISVSSANPTDMASISLTAGDWDVWANIGISANAATACQGWINTTSATIPDRSLTSIFTPTSTAFEDYSCVVLPQRFSLGTTTTIYASGSISFGSGSGYLYGFINARRVR